MVPVRKIPRIALLAAFCLFGLDSVAAAPDLPFRETRNLVMPLFREGATNAFAVVYVASLKAEMQKRGFFKIALLRIAVAREVRIQIASAADVPAALRELPHALRLDKNAPFILKNLSMQIANRADWNFSAEELRPGAGHLALKHLCLSNSPPIESAHLELSDPPRLVFADGKAAELFTDHGLSNSKIIPEK